MPLPIRLRRDRNRRAAQDGLVVRPETTASGAPLIPAGKGFASACYAPFASLWFDPHGKVRACCQNSEFPLGDVRHQTIREIWDGQVAERLRGALRADDFSLGCQFCDWQVHERDPSTIFARNFDEHPVPTTQPRWPVKMEFSLTNACNLQCTMCSGEFSSAIRAHREHLPPLPTVYGDAFFGELAEFLPHLQKANFLGGEPFLGREPLRVLDLMADLELDTVVAITTNGTQWSPRVERDLRAAERGVRPVPRRDHQGDL